MRRINYFLAALLVASIALTVHATPSSAAMRWGAEVFGAFNTHSMDDWNDIIDDANSSGANFDNINSGFSFGVGPQVIVGEQWVIGAHYEMLMPKKSEDSGVEIKPSANAFGGSLAYLFPSSGPMSYGLGVAVDYMSLSGTLSSPTDEADEEGSGVGFTVMGMANHAFSPSVSGGLTVGYRMADIDIDNIGGVDVSGSGLSSENYSGVTVRLGLTFSQPKQ